MSEFRLPDPCTRTFLHHPHAMQVVNLSNVSITLVCPGASAEPSYGPLQAVTTDKP